MKFSLIKSVANVGRSHVGTYDSFDAAVDAAIRVGANGRPEKRTRWSWCFDGGPESVGYWIETVETVAAD